VKNPFVAHSGNRTPVFQPIETWYELSSHWLRFQIRTFFDSLTSSTWTWWQRRERSHESV